MRDDGIRGIQIEDWGIHYQGDGCQAGRGCS